MSLLDLALSAPGGVRMVVETPAGSRMKLAYDPAGGFFEWSRPLPAGLAYPFDWGFFPSTRAADGDPLDAMLLAEAPSFPGVVVACRPVGVLRLEQSEGRRRLRNDRVFAVPLDSQRYRGVRDVRRIGGPVLAELEAFFLQATMHTDKRARILGWSGAGAARAAIRAAARPR